MSKTTIRKGKQDDKYSLAIRDIQVSSPENKKCLDCDQRGPTYINITVGSFVCTKCSGMLRGINPPHRIKSISMSSFTSDEVELMRSRGNAWCRQVWLGTFDKSSPVDFKDDEKIRDFIIDKYEKKLYYVEPRQVSQPKVSASSGSLQSANLPETRPLSALIGTTLKSSLSNSNQGNISIRRPAGGPTAIVRPPVTENRKSVEASLSVFGSSDSSSSLSNTAPAPPPSQPPPPPSTDSFADFANFDTAAFDSMPADPLAAPAPTLPPTKKLSQSSLSSTTTAASTEAKSASDRYAALKDLDDLFRTTTVESPTTNNQPPAVYETPPAPIPTTNIFTNESVGNIFSNDTVVASNSPAWQGNSYGRTSPPQWSQPQQQQPWQVQWDNPTGGGGTVAGGWPVEGGQGGWRGAGEGWMGGVQSVHPTNPFGTSPSGPAPLPPQIKTSDNNNDLFAAAPKPFLLEKSSVADTNPWMSSVPAFTANMTPAPNPNNPFL